MKDKKDELIKSISEYYFSIFMSLSCIQFMAYFICVILKKSTLILHVTPITLLWIIYIYFKDVIDNAKEKKLSFLMLKIDTVIFLVALLNDGILSVFNKIAVNNPGLLKEAIIVVLLVDFMTFLISIVALLNDTVKEKLDMIHETDTKNLLSGKSSEEEIKPGDAVIGYGIEDNKPVILPLKDRYLHMLIIGPTGSGKTSQSVIPMINRDMTNPDIGITVLEPKGDLAEKIFAMAKYYNREVLYFNPILPDCPYFNPLFGLETDVIENMATTFKMLNPDSSQFFLDMNENTIRKALKILKRLKGDDATLLDLDTLLNNTGGQGRKMVMDFSKLQVPNPSVARENSDIAQWFLNDYYSQLSGERGITSTFRYASDIRNKVGNLTSDIILRYFLNPMNYTSPFSSSDCIIVNLGAIKDIDIKNLIINSILLDIFNCTKKDLKKIVYSDLTLNRLKNKLFNDIIFDAKKMNTYCLFSASELSNDIDNLSGFIDNYLISENLSIKDYHYFTKTNNYPGIKSISYNGTFIIDDYKTTLSKDIPYIKIKNSVVDYKKERDSLIKEKIQQDKESEILFIKNKLKTWHYYPYLESMDIFKEIESFIENSDLESLQRTKLTIIEMTKKSYKLDYIENDIERDIEISTIDNFEKNLIYYDSYLKNIKIKHLKPIRIEKESLVEIKDLIYSLKVSLDLKEIDKSIDLLDKEYKKILNFNKLEMDKYLGNSEIENNPTSNPFNKKDTELSTDYEDDI